VWISVDLLTKPFSTKLVSTQEVRRQESGAPNGQAREDLSRNSPSAQLLPQIFTRLARGVLLSPGSWLLPPLVPQRFCLPDIGARGLWVRGLFDKQRNTRNQTGDRNHREDASKRKMLLGQFGD
jgi:hypothetical protein